MNVFDNLISVSQNVRSGKSSSGYKKYESEGIVLYDGNPVSLGAYVLRTSVYEETIMYLNNNGDSSQPVFGFYVLLGGRFTGKTTLLNMLYNNVRESAVLIQVEPINTVGAEELYRIIKEYVSKGKKYIFIDEITLVKSIKSLKGLYKFLYDKGVSCFITGTESVKLLEEVVADLGGRVIFVQAGSDIISASYFEYINTRGVSGSFNSFMESVRNRDVAVNLNMSLQSKVDAFLIKGFQEVRNLVIKLEAESLNQIFSHIIDYSVQGFRTDSRVLNSILLFTYYLIFGTQYEKINNKLYSYLAKSYTPKEGTPGYVELVALTGKYSVFDYYKGLLSELGIIVKVGAKRRSNTDENLWGRRIIEDVFKSQELYTCVNIDLLYQILFAVEYSSTEYKLDFKYNSSRARGMVFEAAFYSVLRERLQINTNSSESKYFKIFKLKYAKDGIDYEIDYTIQSITGNRLFIGLKLGSLDKEASLRDIPVFREGVDKIVIVSASEEANQYDFEKTTSRVGFKQFFTEYLPRWVDWSGVPLNVVPIEYIAK